jgi:eukaryotic-like serine/threonine-protein kinase
VWAAQTFGPHTVNTPDLSNMSESVARATLTEQEFTVGQITSAYHDTVPEGKVASQDPAKDTPQPKGTMVSFVISKGPKPIPVPDIVGKADTEAIKLLQDAGFTPVPGGSKFDKAPNGQVISQTPKAGELTPRGSQITYVTSKGPEVIAVPDVTGMSKSAAIAKLEAARFKVKVSYEFSSTVDSGDVAHQNPSAGGQYPPKTVVTITVSQGAGVTVPDFTSTTTLQDAIDKLKALGLKPSPSTTTSATEDGLVTSTDPAGGTQVKKGATITIHYTASF